MGDRGGQYRFQHYQGLPTCEGKVGWEQCLSQGLLVEVLRDPVCPAFRSKYGERRRRGLSELLELWLLGRQATPRTIGQTAEARPAPAQIAFKKYEGPV